MCRFRILVTNPAYRKMDLSPLEIKMIPDYKILIPCGHCPDCLYSESISWRVRLFEEYSVSNPKRCYFFTLTFSDAFYDHASSDVRYFIRLFLERYRRIVGKSLRHFFVTEYGQCDEYTHRLHLHGICFSSALTINKLKKLWTFGFSHISRVKSACAITYVTKYITKPQVYYGRYRAKKFVSPGLGSSFLKNKSRFFESDGSINFYSLQSYILSNGKKCFMPLYYIRKLLDTYSARDAYKAFLLARRKEPTEEDVFKAFTRSRSSFLFSEFVSRFYFLFNNPYSWFLDYAKSLKDSPPKESIFSNFSYSHSCWIP